MSYCSDEGKSPRRHGRRATTVLMRSARLVQRHLNPGRDKLFKGTRAGYTPFKEKHAATVLPHEVRMVSGLWRMLKETILAFIEDEALSRGAAIAFYTVTSIAPVLPPSSNI